MKASYIHWAPVMIAATIGTAAWRLFWSSVYLSGATKTYSCAHNYNTEILSLDPLVIYINNFLSPHEISRLLELSNFFNYTYLENPIRTSSYFVVDYASEDEVAQCVISRAEKLLGHTDYGHIEPLQMTRYFPGQQFSFHWDHFSDEEVIAEKAECNRPWSFFATLIAPTAGGETYYPYVSAAPETADGNKFSRTNNTGDFGLAVRPIAGNAVLWRNLDEDWKSDDRTLHAGLPVKEGVKVGMNILAEKCGLYGHDDPSM